jgi:hypothetical protein
MVLAVPPLGMTTAMKRALRVLLLGCLAVALGGCVAGNASALLVALFLAAGLAGCSTSHGRTGTDGSVEVDGDVGLDGGSEEGGTWGTCCVEGRVDTCYCPPDTACNYGLGLTICDDGTCNYTGSCDDGGPDAGGTDEPCCESGVITTCFCPAGWECNYGWFTDCGDGTCVDPTTMCPVNVDAGTPDAGGAWEPCCVDGIVDTCFCPAGLACNYGWFTDCGDGTCVGPVETCPAP